MIDIEADLGGVVLGLINHRQEWQGKVVPLGIPTSFTQIASAYAEVFGEPCVAKETTISQAFGWAPPIFQDTMHDMTAFYLEFGNGDDSHTLAETLLGRPLTTIKEYWARMKATGVDLKPMFH